MIHDLQSKNLDRSGIEITRPLFTDDFFFQVARVADEVTSCHFFPNISIVQSAYFCCLFQGAFWGMIVGFIVGAIRMILDFTHLEPRCGEEDTRPSIIAKVHYMYFALILFWITVITIVVISLFTKPMKDANVSKKNARMLILTFFL